MCINLKKIYYFGIIVLGIVLPFASGCKQKQNEPSVWKTDAALIETKIPLLAPIESCLWQSGQLTNHEKERLPAPEEYFIRGYIQISDDVKNQILKDYKWNPVEMDKIQCPKSENSSIPEKFLAGNDYLISDEFMREHAKHSPFSVGRMILSSKTNIIYFDLSNL